MKFEMEGFDKFQKKLDDLARKSKKLDGDHEIPFSELFPNSFMRSYTSFESIDEVFDRSPFNVETEEDFENISEEELDKYVSSNTNFSSWHDMKIKAAEHWTVKQFGF